DSKHHNIILTRSTPNKTWFELTRRGCPALTEDAWHTVVAEIKGGEIVVSLDGAEVVRAKDDTIAAGRIGVGTSQGQVSFRNLKIEGEKIAMAEPLKDETPPYKVISQGEASGTYQAFPDACRLQNGDIMVVFYGGYGHVSLPNDQWPKGGRICTVRTSDEGRTWTQPSVIYDDDQDNRDPHIAQLKDGTLICSFFKYWRVEGKTRYVSMITRSTDGGATWEPEGQPVTPEMWAVSAPVRELPDGTLILGVYSGASYGGIVRSTDDGKTWCEPIPIGKEAKLPLDAETDFVLLKDGTLYAALRSSSINMHYATSPDLGLTWTPVQDIGFKAHAPHFTRLSTGEILMTHRIPNTALHVSRDEAKTWQGPYVIDNVGGAYPATVELKDGSVLAIYYEEGAGSAIRALRFKLQADGIDWLGW
ncbi:MAG: exo-alpha-sialidase, partial [Armatimonadetes bacterium]|nr:exo-alpha-sialidase [Armatimonadota bacterium]